MAAILFGSIGTLADTSELQREAFNAAFRVHSLDWTWDQEDYRERLGSSGGADRVTAYAQERGDEVDSAAVHATKSQIFQERLAAGGITARPGVAATIAAARGAGWKVGFVTTTAPENVDALLGALAPEVSADSFDLVLNTSDAEHPKPAPDVYLLALARLGEDAASCVAVEDNPGGAEAAAAAGIACAAFPNENTAALSFPEVAARVDHLDLSELRALAGAA